MPSADKSSLKRNTVLSTGVSISFCVRRWFVLKLIHKLFNSILKLEYLQSIDGNETFFLVNREPYEKKSIQFISSLVFTLHMVTQIITGRKRTQLLQ